MKKIKMYPSTFSGAPAVQVESELSALIDFFKRNSVTSYLEVGCGRGDTFHEIVRSLPSGSKAVAVDLPQAGWGLSGSESQLEAAAADLRLMGYDVRLIFGSSRDESVIMAAAEFGPFDAVFIDGDHTIEGVTADWQNYGHMGNIVAFHDIADSMRPNALREKIEVPVFWRRLKDIWGEKTAEFVERGSTMGIGVLWRDAPC